MDKKKIKIMIGLFLLVTLILGGLTIYKIEFLSALLLWASLLLFSICYYIKDNDKKIGMYSLFIIGVLLIIGALVYLAIRIG